MFETEGDFGENPDPRVESYERHLAEIQYLKLHGDKYDDYEEEDNPASVRNADRKEKYAEFLRNYGHLATTSFNEHTSTKGEGLETSFPGRFGPKGKQPLSRYDGAPTKLGALFSRMVQESRKIVG